MTVFTTVKSIARRVNKLEGPGEPDLKIEVEGSPSPWGFVHGSASPASGAAAADTSTASYEVLQFPLRRSPRWPADSSGKRLFDVVIGGAALVAIIPLVLVLAFAILVADRRWPFYVDRRVGLNGKTFGCFKLRTLSSDPAILEQYFARFPEERLLYEQTRKLTNDPRCSKLGRVLRQWSLDELPQIAHVAFGQMSLVGPRPLSPREFLARGHRRAALGRARPGLTGLWQVSGRGDTSARSRKALEHYYVTRWSPALDLRILLVTPYAVLSRRGAR